MYTRSLKLSFLFAAFLAAWIIPQTVQGNMWGDGYPHLLANCNGQAKTPGKPPYEPNGYRSEFYRELRNRELPENYDKLKWEGEEQIFEGQFDQSKQRVELLLGTNKSNYEGGTEPTEMAAYLTGKLGRDIVYYTQKDGRYSELMEWYGSSSLGRNSLTEVLEKVIEINPTIEFPIHFSLDRMDLRLTFSPVNRNYITGKLEAAHKTFTDVELLTILINPQLFSKTAFYVNGRQLTSAEVATYFRPFKNVINRYSEFSESGVVDDNFEFESIETIPPY